MTALTAVPVEDVKVGDRIFVSRKIGCRRVAEIIQYDTQGLEKVDSFTILYDAPEPAMCWENRAGAKGKVTYSPRDVMGLRPYRRGEHVQLERLHLIERS